jgi:hypothetical protein
MMIARKLSLLATCLLALAATPAGAQQAAPAPESVSSSVRARALDLARLTAPSDLSLEADVRGAEKAFFAGFRGAPDGAALEAKNPGIVEILWKAVEPIIRQASIDNQGAYWNELADVYAARLSAREIEAMNVFYGSPSGRKVVAGMYANLNMDPIIAQMVEDPDFKVPAGTARTAVRDAAEKTATSLGKSDQLAAALLTRTVSEAKLQAVGAAVQELQLKWANKEFPELDGQVDAAVKAAAERYFREHPQSN